MRIIFKWTVYLSTFSVNPFKIYISFYFANRRIFLGLFAWKKRKFLDRKSYFLKNWILLISLKGVSRFNFGRFVSKSDNFLGQVCILGAVDLNWRKMFILMSLETGFDHNHFGEKDIIVLFWLFHSNIESFRVLTAFFCLENSK